jgi:hypothetical protein
MYEKRDCPCIHEGPEICPCKIIEVIEIDDDEMKQIEENIKKKYN